MDSLPSVSPSMVLPPTNPFRRHTRRLSLFSRHLPPRLFSTPRVRTNRRKEVSCNVVGGGGADDGGNEEEVEKALHMDGKIPGSSDEFLKQVSSRAYDMRRNLHQSFDSSSYDVLDDNPWRETSKPVYVLTQKENQLCTMKTRRNISEVERELGLLFSKGSNRRAAIENQSKQARGGTKFPMQVEDIRDGVLVFEDENEAAKYCDLLQGGCEGVAEIDASSIFDLCKKMRALAVLFRRGRTPPVPESLKLNLRARKRSLEDQDDLI
ncbi:hypothetical protein MtrunA17_Chr5g0418031 [Medicago truncatula]|uniref:Plant/M4I22-120 protein, putative n=1 Tax=Medicago truncatula TaxID=3880 RepID=G7JWJ7_MEDTR|nr:uncharacterized protein LOC11427768 [Medicago truncatula]AES96869.1 plant/M4I22-120 protein, putative [Medicago truncatula]RHN55462.1 hypothetical protein MtrunA17_Chr5g0418031 [Medicago truncatula]